MKKLLALAVCLMLLGTIAEQAEFSLGEFFEIVTDSIFAGSEADKPKELDIETVVMRRAGGKLVKDEDNAQVLNVLNLPEGFRLEETERTIEVDGMAYKLWDLGGVIDKFIFVRNTNTGSKSQNAYFRSAISICCPDEVIWNKIRINLNLADYQWNVWENRDVWREKDGWYTAVATYPGMLAPGETAPALMMQVALVKGMTAEEKERFGADFTIECKTVAIDRETFAENGMQLTAAEALNRVAPVDSFQ